MHTMISNEISSDRYSLRAHQVDGQEVYAFWDRVEDVWASEHFHASKKEALVEFLSKALNLAKAMGVDKS
tara:strand:+ start:158 stop:367 length:210 start_codon:yes stop_codon:yes gene_type:complete